MKRFISLLLCIVFILSFAGCGAQTLPMTDDNGKQGTPVSDDSTAASQMTFNLVVVDLNGNRTEKEIKTDRKTVGDALLSQGVIEGEKGDYGLYVTSVNGVSLDYKKDGAYWSFYVGDAYASKGVDQTDIVDGETYMLKAETAQ